MSIVEAYNLLLKRLETNSHNYNIITNSSDPYTVSLLYLLSNYRKYLINRQSKDKRVSSLKSLNKTDYKYLFNLCESLAAFIDVFCLDKKNILLQTEELIDPLDLLDISCTDLLSGPTTVIDDTYENVCRSILNILVEDNFELFYKSLFLKFASIKKI